MYYHLKMVIEYYANMIRSNSTLMTCYAFPVNKITYIPSLMTCYAFPVSATNVTGSILGRQMLRNSTSPGEKTYNFEDALRDSDQTCSRYRYTAPPQIANATMKTRYMFNEARRLWSTVANYTCKDGFMLQNTQSRYMFCSNYKWRAPVRPKCTKG